MQQDYRQPRPGHPRAVSGCGDAAVRTAGTDQRSFL